jgi:hypothetical protein
MDMETEKDMETAIETDMETEKDMETVIETDMETEMAWKWKWTWKWKHKLYLIQRNSPYSTMRIVANMSMAQFPMALCTCSTYLL